MRFSKPKDEGGGRREDRRRARERAREARKKREEIERRATALQAPAAEKSTTPEKKPEKKPKDAGAKKPSISSEKEEKATKSRRSARSEKPAKKSKSEPRRGTRLSSLPGELSRRLSLAKLGALLAPVLALLIRAVRFICFLILRLAGVVEAVLKRTVGIVAPPIAGLVAWLGRTVTPKRAALTVAAAAFAAALVSQAIDYRAVAIGGEAYADVASLAQAPLAEHATPWTVHGPLIGLLAFAAAAGSILTLRGGDRRALLCAVGASAAGILAILGFDLPKAGDLGEAAAEYAGTDAVLLEGFYIQLTAMFLLGFTALLPSIWKRKAL